MASKARTGESDVDWRGYSQERRGIIGKERLRTNFPLRYSILSSATSGDSRCIVPLPFRPSFIIQIELYLIEECTPVRPNLGTDPSNIQPPPSPSPTTQPPTTISPPNRHSSSSPKQPPPRNLPSNYHRRKFVQRKRKRKIGGRPSVLPDHPHRITNYEL